MFDFDTKVERLEEVLRQMEDPTIWNNPDEAQKLGQEKATLEKVVDSLKSAPTSIKECLDMLELAAEEEDQELVESVTKDLDAVARDVAALEFQRMFSDPMDANNAFIDIQSGSGGTEAQDWANMLLRMYLRWAEANDFKTEMIEVSEGEVAGIKSATVKIIGEYAFGFLRTETGVHRLVRKSPFDSGNRRHTSFASLYAYPEIDDNIEIEVNPADIRTDTYRASGAGGQHINKTDSAVRITHEPTGIVVQCQNDRSQHRNRESAMAMLKARLYEHEMQQRRSEQQSVEDEKSDIGWGSQIRSYVLDQSRIKDLRTGVETGNTQGVLDGDLNQFIEASLKQGL
ncbi:MAG: peptide chain release factor 2 [Acidiferrobacterales bacterium]|nr:peptide chain release factor 2 [Acidiferrobacterales bacterium]